MVWNSLRQWCICFTCMRLTQTMPSYCIMAICVTMMQFQLIYQISINCTLARTTGALWLCILTFVPLSPKMCWLHFTLKVNFPPAVSHSLFQCKPICGRALPSWQHWCSFFPCVTILFLYLKETFDLKNKNKKGSLILILTKINGYLSVVYVFDSFLLAPFLLHHVGNFTSGRCKHVLRPFRGANQTCFMSSLIFFLYSAPFGVKISVNRKTIKTSDAKWHLANTRFKKKTGINPFSFITKRHDMQIKERYLWPTSLYQVLTNLPSFFL